MEQVTISQSAEFKTWIKELKSHIRQSQVKAFVKVPDMNGFSYRNLRYIRQWYEMYAECISNWQQVAASLDIMHSKAHRSLLV